MAYSFSWITSANLIGICWQRVLGLVLSYPYTNVAVERKIIFAILSVLLNNDQPSKPIVFFISRSPIEKMHNL